MKPTIINVADLPDDPNNPDGLTIREVNQKKKHKFSIGELVEVKYDLWFGDGACIKAHARLWVIEHNRDCDKTPLYSLASKTRKTLEEAWSIDFDNYTSRMKIGIWCETYIWGISERNMTLIEVTPEIARGTNSLSWEES